MLKIRTYTRQELIELFKTDRLDSIKGKIKRQGYEYTTDGRGKTFTLTITKLPLNFRNFCIEELGFAPQTDFKRLKKFLYRFFFDEEFRKLPTTEMVRVLANDFYITDDTLNRWIDKLIKLNMICRSNVEFNYYCSVYDTFGDKVSIPIDERTYKDAWSAYYRGREFSYCEACSNMYAVSGGTPFKVGIILENAFEAWKIDTLKEILQKEINIDE